MTTSTTPEAELPEHGPEPDHRQGEQGESQQDADDAAGPDQEHPAPADRDEVHDEDRERDQRRGAGTH